MTKDPRSPDDAKPATVREAFFEVARRLNLTTIFGNPGSTEETLLKDFPADFRYVLTLREVSGNDRCPTACGRTEVAIRAPDDLLSGHRPSEARLGRGYPSWDSECGPVAAQPHHRLAAIMLLADWPGTV